MGYTVVTSASYFLVIQNMEKEKIHDCLKPIRNGARFEGVACDKIACDIEHIASLGYMVIYICKIKSQRLYMNFY